MKFYGKYKTWTLQNIDLIHGPHIFTTPKNTRGNKNRGSMDLVHGKRSMDPVCGPGSMFCTFPKFCIHLLHAHTISLQYSNPAQAIIHPTPLMPWLLRSCLSSILFAYEVVKKHENTEGGRSVHVNILTGDDERADMPQYPEL